MATRPAPLLEKYGPWALITGASDGIGEAFARALAAAGFNLIVVARRAAKLQTLVDDLSATYSIEAVAFAIDLSLESNVNELLSRTAKYPIGLFIPCAGFGTSGEFIEQSLRDELNMLDVNCRAVTQLSHQYAQEFARMKRGGIILMSSIVAFQGVPRASHYAATKAYIQTLAEGLHQELAGLGVDVLASAPGPIKSGFAKRANMQMGLTQLPSAVAQASLRALGKKITVRPGWLAKLLSTALSVPRWARVKIMAQVMQGMTKHQ